MNKITVTTVVTSPLTHVWNAWITPSHIQKWCHASDDWECPYAENDLRVDGKFLTRMSAKDGSVSFDFNGIYTEVSELSKTSYTIEGGRKVEVIFEKVSDTETRVTATFDPEDINPLEMQQGGWQSILNNFKSYTETIHE